MRLWSWQAVAQGADAVLFFQWRQSRGGSEKFHSAMLPHGGPGTRTFRAVCELGRELAMASAIAGSRIRNRVALLLDWENWWAMEPDGQPSRDVRQWDLLLACYAPLFAAGIGTDVVHPATDLSGYRLIVAPSLYLLETPVASALAEYVRAGGHLVVTFFSGIVDARDQVHPGGYPGPLRELLGLRVEEFWPLAAGDSAALRDPGEVPGADDDGGLGDGAEGTLWSEEIVTEGAETIAEFADTELAGLPAVTRHPSGAGVAWYLGTLPDPASLRALLGRVAAEAEVSPVLPGLPDGVQATIRHGAAERFVFLLNHAPAPRDVRLPAPMRDMLSVAHDPVDQLVLPPRGVAVLSTPS
jgi:beta-galactosidase